MSAEAPAAPEAGHPSVGAVTDEPTEPRPGDAARGGSGPFVAVALLALALGAAIVAVAVWGGSGGDAVRVEIPPGTAATLDRGERAEVLDRVVAIDVGQRFVVENRDGRPHVVGPVLVGPGETAEHVFEVEGVFTETSTVHAQRAVTFVVE